jgi:ribosomal protein L15
VKILGDGELKVALTVQRPRVQQVGAGENRAAGGKVEILK